ncbi:hypothetical protein SAMN05421681_10621 [Lysobacter enzymogenes]|nr:hypothetical protein SAMN05421681_10621 [Lysobacter enzymogenes]
MLNRKVRLSLLTCALATSGCSSVGPAVKPECPRLAPVAPSLMQPPQTEQKVRQILFESPPSATPPSAGSKPR